ncbi:rhamnulokinase [Mobilitalea sibirica]|uniref:Rhamnulokinase n=1 Tax=Mobilitalea sibirica TaxID=1462919 RepID=A0A8J7GYF8_9FIRM|nr:rhamnulokinase [Mobilitalea sibirica]MBH1940509.1 rhamnulokinase [Mobilitalea sibirica]
MQKYYLAIDIGASSGRHVLGYMNNGKLTLEEVYRFENNLIKQNKHLCWDLKGLFQEIVNGLKICKKQNRIPTSMGIDTWAVDFVLLDKDGQILGDTVAYRDSRTNGMDRKVGDLISLESLYQRTGIQKLNFNTIYQLMAVKQNHPKYLDKAKDFLMIPDYFHYLLTGNKCVEYTNATTTQLVNLKTKDWDYELMDLLEFPRDIFKAIHMPMTVVGSFRKDIIDEVGFDCQVVLPATHDTGSAVLAVPSKQEDFIYLSSGTWSLMGIESMKPYNSAYSMEHNFTNEGGFEYRYRCLKNIMGLWMVQCIRRELKSKCTYEELCQLAKEADDFPSRLDVNAEVFLAPESMIQEIKYYCKKTNQPIPVTIGELAACIYHSLAESYAVTVNEIERLTGITYSGIHIVGGGSNAGYLNELTAKATGKEIYIGPVEATAIGNLLVQMMKDNVFCSLKDARECVYHSFEIQKLI